MLNDENSDTNVNLCSDMLTTLSSFLALYDAYKIGVGGDFNGHYVTPFRKLGLLVQNSLRENLSSFNNDQNTTYTYESTKQIIRN